MYPINPKSNPGFVVDFPLGEPIGKSRMFDKPGFWNKLLYGWLMFMVDVRYTVSMIWRNHIICIAFMLFMGIAFINVYGGNIRIYIYIGFPKYCYPESTICRGYSMK